MNQLNFPLCAFCDEVAITMYDGSYCCRTHAEAEIASDIEWQQRQIAFEERRIAYLENEAKNEGEEPWERA